MLTIHEMREKDAAKLAAKIDNPTRENLESARHAL